MPTETPSRTSEAEASRQRLTRTGLCAIAAFIVLFTAVDAAAVGRFPTESFLVRLVWAGTVVLLARRLPASSMRAYAAVIRAVVLVSVFCLALVATLTGGVQSPLFIAIPVLPIVALVFTQDDLVAVQLTLATSVVAIGAMLLHERAGWPELARWFSFTIGMGAIALYGSSLFGARRRAELATERSRADVLEQLATSERRRAEAERLATIGQLAAGVAHEINNPLAYALANLNFLSEQIASSEKDSREALGDAMEGLTRIAQIVRDLRSFSRAEGEQLERIELRPVLEEALRLASMRLHGAQVALEVAPELGPIVTAQGRLLQVMVNLIVNAADALEGATKAAQPAVRVSARAIADRVRICVADNGPGIAPELLERVFEPFFTTKPAGKGTGLGLSLSREYVERLSGRLWAENRVEGGALFTIELPTSTDAA